MQINENPVLLQTNHAAPIWQKLDNEISIEKTDTAVTIQKILYKKQVKTELKGGFITTAIFFGTTNGASVLFPECFFEDDLMFFPVQDDFFVLGYMAVFTKTTYVAKTNAESDVPRGQTAIYKADE